MSVNVTVTTDVLHWATFALTGAAAGLGACLLLQARNWSAGYRYANERCRWARDAERARQARRADGGTA